MSKNKKNKKTKIKVRRTWNIHPGTQIHSVDTKNSNRTQLRLEWEFEVENELFEEDDLDEEIWEE